MPQHHTRANSLAGSLRQTLRSFKVPSRVLENVAVDLYESLDNAISLSCEILLRYGEYEQLLSKSVDPSDFEDAYRYRDAAQAVSFLRKVPFKKAGIDPEAKARESFLQAEVSCLETNRRLRSFVENRSNASPRVKAILCMAALEIQRIIGSSVNSREWLYACRFGPGAFTHSEVKGLTSLYDKLQVRPSVSHDMKGLGALLVTSLPPWARSITDSEIDGFWPIINESDLDLVPGNRIAFVPKTAITHRTIAIEPLLNIYAQLGLGTMLRRRLLKNGGIDLDDQTPNQEMARLGSIDSSLATIDLSSASDTVARELVRFLIPDSWYDRMDLCRSKVGLLDGQWIRYEKFSSMGNGYTFELETLIFLGLALGCVSSLNLDPSKVRVYGDDIVVPTEAYDLLVEVLTFCGFKVNPKKSFASGPFRESCGKDWFNGIEVRPFFQKECLNEIQHLFRLANGLRMLAHRRNNLIGCDVRLFKPWLTVLRAIPRSISQHLRVPCNAGDSDGIKSNWDESQSSLFILTKWGWEGFFGLRYQSTPVRVRHPNNFLGVIADLLFRLKDGRTLDSVSSPPRLGRDYEYRLNTRAFFGPWTDFGGWR